MEIRNYKMMLMMNTVLVLIFVVKSIECVDKPFGFVGAKGTQHARKKTDPKYYTTNSQIPHLPFVTGFVGTAGTYRFMVVSSQTALVVGEAKHGLWRVQENGFVREYRIKERTGIPPTLDPNSATTLMDSGHKQAITHNYAFNLPEEGESFYKYPDQKVSDGSDGVKGHANFVDLSIYHPKYGGKYNDHVPIDLPYYHCMMSGPSFDHLKKMWDYMVAQPKANKFGPLGLRAGFDIKENFQNVLRVQQFGDAGIWVNIGSGDASKDAKIDNLSDARDRAQSANYQRIDLSKMQYEIYYFERVVFNTPYMFVGLVLENMPGEASEFSYLRPDGVYFDELSKKMNVSGFGNSENYNIKVPVENFPNQGQTTVKATMGLPLYGMHHPNRIARGMSGGACPEKGGDVAYYPWGNPGSSWPTTYEEVTPICDAFAIDLKFWADLDKSWNDPAVFIGNAGFENQMKVDYVLDANKYGTYEHPFLKNRKNPHAVDFTTDGKHVGPGENIRKPNPISLKVDFSRMGKVIDFNNLSSIHEVEIDSPVTQTQCVKQDSKIIVEEKKCDYESSILITILVVVLLIFIVNLVAILYFCCRNSNSGSGKHVAGRDNTGTTA